MAIRPDGQWSSKEVGICVSRQNGKGAIIEAITLWALFVNEEQVLHTAHNFKTASAGFKRIAGLIMGSPTLKAEVKRIVYGHGEEAIELKSGAGLMFGTRTKGGARGQTFDRVFCDEAMFLTDDHMGALLPTVSARPNPQFLYLGSAGDKDSIYFGRVRSRALTGNDPALFYAEWSIDACTNRCPPDCVEHDPPDSVESYAKANPGMGIRISVEHIESERRSMSSEMFAQERLSVGDWPVDGDTWTVIDRDSWMARVDLTSDIAGPFALAVDTTPDRAQSCIVVAGLNAAGLVHIEIAGDGEEYAYHPGMQWVVPTVLAIWKGQKPSAVIIDKAGPASSFIDQLEAAGVKVASPTTREYAQACGDLYSAVVPRRGEEATLVHMDQAPLNGAVAGADSRLLADMWAWSRRGATADISPLAAVTLAMWGQRKFANARKPRAKAAWG